MSILDNMPHLADAQIRTRTKDALGGSKDTWVDVFTDRACWRQPASAAEIMEFQKRGITIHCKVYFTSDPGLDETHRIVVNGDAMTVRSSAHPDASAGLGTLWRVFAELED